MWFVLHQLTPPYLDVVLDDPSLSPSLSDLQKYDYVSGFGGILLMIICSYCRYIYGAMMLTDLMLCDCQY